MLLHIWIGRVSPVPSRAARKWGNRKVLPWEHHFKCDSLNFSWCRIMEVESTKKHLCWNPCHRSPFNLSPRNNPSWQSSSHTEKGNKISLYSASAHLRLENKQIMTQRASKNWLKNHIYLKKSALFREFDWWVFVKTPRNLSQKSPERTFTEMTFRDVPRNK